MTINFSVIVVVHILGTPIQIQKEVAIGNQDLDGERELDINFNAGEMLTDANKMIGHESEISTTKVKSRSRKRN